MIHKICPTSGETCAEYCAPHACRIAETADKQLLDSKVIDWLEQRDDMADVIGYIKDLRKAYLDLKYKPSQSEYQYQTNKYAEESVKNLGYEPGQLQWLWRSYDTDPHKYHLSELPYAILDALCREGVAANYGDGVICVADMVSHQLMRVKEAEAKIASLEQKITELETYIDSIHQNVEDI